MLNSKVAKIIFSIIIFVVVLVGIQNLSLAKGDFSASASKTTLNEGESTSLTINAISCGGQFSIKSSNSGVVSVSTSSQWIENGSQSVTLKANKPGKATITVTANNVAESSSPFGPVTGSKRVTITVPEPKVEKPIDNNSNSSKSSDASLKAITIGGKNYSNPDTRITAPSVSADTSSIKIYATANDSKAKISGTGTKDLVTGTNKFTIKVTAENGATKSYVIKVTRLAEENNKPNVEEENPPAPSTKEEVPQELRLTSLVIQGVELIPVFTSETFEYSAYITNEEEVKIDATSNIEGANIEITGNTDLVEGENIAVIKLTKDDKTVEYKIKINKTAVIEKHEDVYEEKHEENKENSKVGFMGTISNWWNGPGATITAFTLILMLCGGAVIFAVMAYKYSSNPKEASRHSREDF